MLMLIPELLCPIWCHFFLTPVMISRGNHRILSTSTLWAEICGGMLWLLADKWAQFLWQHEALTMNAWKRESNKYLILITWFTWFNLHVHFFKFNFTQTYSFELFHKRPLKWREMWSGELESPPCGSRCNYTLLARIDDFQDAISNSLRPPRLHPISFHIW